MSLFSLRLPAILTRFSRETLIFLAIALLGLGAMIAGGVLTYQTHFQHPKFSYMPTDQVWKDHLQALVERARRNVDASVQASETVTVEVAGAVVQPGVYVLARQARVQDALLAAGGFLPDSNKQYIHQELNLARTLGDQEKLYIPLFEERVKDEGNTLVASNEVAREGIHANTITLTELMEIDGIGEKRAEDFLAGQPYTNVEDVRKRSRLPASILSTLEEKGMMF